jgi:PAS domain S-box-containing protein
MCHEQWRAMCLGQAPLFFFCRCPMNTAADAHALLLPQLIQAMVDAVLLVDQDGVIQLANEAAAALFGYPREVLEGHHIDRLIPTHLRSAHQAHHQAFFARPTPRQMGATALKTPALRSSGETFDAKVSLSPLHDGRVLVTIVDVSLITSTREALRKYAMILEQMASAVVITNKDGHIEYVNPGFERMTGYLSEEVMGQHTRVLESNETPRSTLEALRQTLAAGHTWQGDLRARRKNGSLFWQSAIISPIRDSVGDITHFAAVMDDVSARKEVEAALARRESLLSLLIEHVPLAVAMLDRDMRYITVSHRWITDYGLAQQTLIGRSHYDIFPEISTRWKEVHQRCLAGATERMDDECFIRKDGSVMWLRWEVRPWYQTPGEVGGILIFTEDITVRKLSEGAVAMSEQRFRATFEQAAVGIAHIAPDGRWIRVNQKLCSLLRYPHGTLLQITIRDVTHPDDLHTDADLMQQLLDGRIEHYAIDKRYLRRNGEPIWVTLTVALVRRPDGQPDYFIFVVEDIDARKTAEAELRRLRMDMEQVMSSHVAVQTAAAIAHELNQPLHAIAAYTAAALRFHQAAEPQKDRVAHALQSASEQAQRAGQVIRELMQLLHTCEIASEPIDVNVVVKDAIAIFQTTRATQSRILIDLKPDLGPVLANRLQIEKVVINLLQNGMEAMKAAGVSTKQITVTVTTCFDDTMALISVRDQGPGLKPESVSSIFQPFFSTKKKGLGMGLAISRALVEAHGGKLWVDLHNGPGATFRFTLPLAP